MAKKPTLNVEFKSFKDKFNVEIYYNRLTRRVKSIISKDGMILLEEKNKATKDIVDLLDKSDTIVSLGIPEKSTYIKKILVNFSDGTTKEVEMLDLFDYFKVAKIYYENQTKEGFNE